MSAYRAAHERGRLHQVLCPTCGAAQRVAEQTYHCRKCGQEQLLFPKALPETTTLVLVGASRQPDRDKALRDAPQIQPLMASLGVDDGDDALHVESNGVEVRVWVRTNSGTPVGLVFVIEVPSTLTVTFHRETAAHRAAKADGVTVEVETGDPQFDEEVFVDSLASAEDLRSFLAARATRLAVRALLAEVPGVVVRAEKVETEIDERGEVDAPKARRIIAALRALAGAARPVDASEVGMPPRVRALALLQPVVLLIAIVLLVYAGRTYTPIGALPVFAGALGGLVLAFVVSPLIRWLVAGTSRSHDYLATARAVLAVDFALLGVGIVLLVNGAFDKSPARDVVMPAVDVSYDSEDHDAVVEVKTDAPGLAGNHTFRFSDPKKAIHLPAEVRLRYHRGALGFPWQVGKETLHRP